MKTATLLLSAVMCMPLPALAQDYSGSVTLGYGFGKVKLPAPAPDIDVNSFTFDGNLKVQLESNVSFGFRADYGNIDVDIPGFPGGFPNVNANLLGANVAYGFGNGGWAGVYVEHSDVGLDLIPINFGTTSYGIEGGYSMSGLDVSGFVGKSTDITSFGIAARYEPTAGAVIGASAMRSSIRSDMFVGIKPDIDVIGIAGAYNFGNGFGIFGGAARTDIGNIPGLDADLTTFGLGASYTLQTGVTPVALSLEFARSHPGGSSLGGVDVDFDTVRLGVTVPFGTTTTVVPKNSVADAILNPSHAAISQSVLLAF